MKIEDVNQNNILTYAELEELEQDSRVINVENNGNSGFLSGSMWYTITLDNLTEIDIYIYPSIGMECTCMATN